MAGGGAAGAGPSAQAPAAGRLDRPRAAAAGRAAHDTVIFGTGFKAAEYLGSLDVYGAGGRRLHDEWQDGAEAYLGTAVPGYPNLFTLYGPNTNGVTSIIYILEAQTEFVRRALDVMVDRGLETLEVKRDVHDAFNLEIQEAMVGTVWMANCNNYFRHTSGKVVTQFPYSGRTFAQRLAQVEMDVFGQMVGSPVIGVHHTAIVTGDVERVDALLARRPRVLRVVRPHLHR